MKIAAILAFGLWLSAPAGAAVVYSEASSQIQGYDRVFESATASTAAVSAQSSQAAVSPAGGSASTRASARAGIGSIGAFATAQANAPTDVQSQASAQWSDSFSIGAADRSGTVGTFSGRALVSGSLFAAANGNVPSSAAAVIANLFVDTGVPDGNVSLQGGGRRIVGVDVDETSGLENFSLSFSNLPFVFGEAISVTLRLLASTGTRTSSARNDLANGSALATAFYLDTMTWGGITDVRDPTGALVADYSAISRDSGYDFAAPAIALVPEPSSGMLLLSGLVVLAVSRRERAGRPTRHVRQDGVDFDDQTSFARAASAAAPSRNVASRACRGR